MNSTPAHPEYVGHEKALEAVILQRLMDKKANPRSRLVLDDVPRVSDWVAEQVSQTTDWGGRHAMGVERDGSLVAGVVFNNFNGANVTCHIAIAGRTKLLTKLFAEVCRYAFDHCKLKRITGMVPSNEPKTIAFDKKLGFVEEFIMKDGAPDADMHVLVLWPENRRW